MRKRAERAANIEVLVKLLKEHVEAAHDHAQATAAQKRATMTRHLMVLFRDGPILTIQNRTLREIIRLCLTSWMALDIATWQFPRVPRPELLLLHTRSPHIAA
jgi:hypothetical protein